jgi:integrase
VRGTVYRRCWCRDPDTKKPYTAKGPCPKLSQKKHGKWYARYDSSVPGRRQPVLGPFATRGEAEGELAAALAREGGGGTTLDRSLRVCAYLEEYMAGKRNLKASTRETDEEAFRLYWKPAIGPRMRLAELRDRHVSQVIDEMLRVNRPLAAGEQPSEMLRRMTEARADDERRNLGEGEERHKKSPKPLSPARIERMFAPFRAAMNAAVKTGKIVRSPCDGVELPRAPKQKPLAWTPAREERFRAELGRRTREAEAKAEEQGRVLTTVERRRLWASPSLRPVPSMVWLPSHTGRFLDYLEDSGNGESEDGEEKKERLGVLYLTDAYCGLRRDEITGLHWTETDLDAGVAAVLETASGEGPKSESGSRPVPLPEVVVDALRAWRRVQAADRLAWGPDWQDTGLVFTREDGSPVTGQWVSSRFETLAFRAGLPPVRFHDLRHGAASMLKAAGIDTKIISAILGHSRTSFTDAAYVTLFPDVERIAADAAAAVVPRRPRRREGAG